MNIKKVAVLTSRKSWFVPYAKKLVNILKSRHLKANLYHKHAEIDVTYGVVFILSYFKKIDKKYLMRHKHNLVVHESDLPKGKGWAPLFWQILEGKNKISIVLFEATGKIDSGGIYLKECIKLNGHELHSEIRKKQAEKTVELCLAFLKKYKKLKLKKQKGRSTFYKKRTPSDSELNIRKTLEKQINLLRIANNNAFPSFFRYRGYKYILKIYKES